MVHLQRFDNLLTQRTISGAESKLTRHFDGELVATGLEVLQPWGVLLQETSPLTLLQSVLHPFLQLVDLLVILPQLHLHQLVTTLPKRCVYFLHIVLTRQCRKILYCCNRTA